MGLRSWWKGSASPAVKSIAPSIQITESSSSSSAGEIPGMNGAEEVRRLPTEVTVFEFGSAAASGDKVTIAGYCPVSDDIEPCRWEIIPATESDAPQFRVVF